jgi:hypothetical protein
MSTHRSDLLTNLINEEEEYVFNLYSINPSWYDPCTNVIVLSRYVRQLHRRYITGPRLENFEYWLRDREHAATYPQTTEGEELARLHKSRLIRELNRSCEDGKIFDRPVFYELQFNVDMGPA